MTAGGREDDARLGRLFAALVGDAGSLGDASPAAGGEGGLDVEGLSRSLVSSAEPLALLRRFVRDVRRRGRAHASAAETHLAERLREAGLDDAGLNLPPVSVVRPRTSGLFYLRMGADRLTYASKTAVVRIEAALNAALLAEHVLDNASQASAEELVRAEQRVARSIDAQAREAASALGEPAVGEWAVRRALSLGIESFRLPYRLTARFRVNAEAGTAAFEVDLVPPRAWAATSYVDGLGVVPSTAEMRRRAATDYNLRLGVLVAAYAFAAAPQLGEVWVAGVVDTSSDHACYYSVRFERDDFEELGVELVGDVLLFVRSCDAVLAERGRTLAPIRQGFSLDDERFCPSWRWDAPELSGAALPAGAARALGCTHVADLGVNEAARRERAAAALVRELGQSTEKNVRALLACAAAAGGDVAAAARRCVAELIDGSLEDDPAAISWALVAGDPLSREVARARSALEARDPASAERIAAAAAAEVDAAGTYDDSVFVTWRAFESHCDRVLYNRLLGRPGEDVRLVSAAYHEAHTIASVAALAQGRATAATAHARRAAEVAPLSAASVLNLSHCLEAAGEASAAEHEVRRLLLLAHDPEACGLGYLRMAQLKWQDGDLLAAQACCQRAGRFLGARALVAGLTVVAVAGAQGTSLQAEIPEERLDAVLEASDVPPRPYEAVAETLRDAARAATDAGLFGVAKDLLHALARMERDDVYLGMLRSLEDEPDR